MKRQMAFNGSFYPSAKGEITRFFNHFDNLIKEHNLEKEVASKIVIVPHAGYIYSGFSATFAYKALAKSGIEHILVVGPSHRVAFNGSSVCGFEAYETPLGAIKANKEMQKYLQEHFLLTCKEELHKEHSTEVQFPFIASYLPGVDMVELVYSRENAQNLADILADVLTQPQWGVVISTDLSHFYTQDVAQKKDAICLEAILSDSVAKLHQGCEACGKLGVEALLLALQKNPHKAVLLDYRTSADTSGDTNRVVGYVSVAFTKE